MEPCPGKNPESTMAASIADVIVQFVREGPGNHFPDSGEPYFDAPLAGYATAVDPFCSEYKQIIGAFHQTPEEILPGAASVRRGFPVKPLCRREESNRDRDNGEAIFAAVTGGNDEGCEERRDIYGCHCCSARCSLSEHREAEAKKRS
jgi:epoxyqueuosine reductase